MQAWLALTRLYQGRWAEAVDKLRRNHEPCEAFRDRLLVDTIIRDSLTLDLRLPCSEGHRRRAGVNRLLESLLHPLAPDGRNAITEVELSARGVRPERLEQRARTQALHDVSHDRDAETHDVGNFRWCLQAMRVHHAQHESLKKHLVETRFGYRRNLWRAGLEKRFKLLASDTSEPYQVIAERAPQLALTG